MFTKAFKEHFLGVGLNGSPAFHFIHGLVTTRFCYDKDPNSSKTPTTVPLPRRPRASQRKFLNLESTERGVASMSADDKA